LTTSGRSIGAGVWSESKPRLLNEFNYVPWDLGRPPSLKGLRPDFPTKTDCAVEEY